MQENIRLFMWGYQRLFRFSLQFSSERLMANLGVDFKPKTLLVGVRLEDHHLLNPICIEPEDEEWDLEIFKDLADLIRDNVNSHELGNAYYTDMGAMQDKPSRIFYDSTRRAITQSLNNHLNQDQWRAFAPAAVVIDSYLVVPVIQIPKSYFVDYPQLGPIDPIHGIQTFNCFLEAAVSCLLVEFTELASKPNPGRNLDSPDLALVSRMALMRFSLTLDLALKGNNYDSSLFDKISKISSIYYEQSKCSGNLILARQDHPNLRWSLRLSQPILMRDHRWARKALQMASQGFSMISDGSKIFGFGSASSDHQWQDQDLFIVDFLDHFQWQLRCGENLLLRSHYGEPSLPRHPINKAHFLENYHRLFRTATVNDAESLWVLFLTACSLGHGSMIVVADDAKNEAARLSNQGTAIEPILLTPDLFAQLSMIDGTILVDASITCHSIGVILDGPANSHCTPARGSRFNSGVRYVHSSDKNRLAIIVSDDKTADLVPLLRPRISRRQIEESIAELETSDKTNYHKLRIWLDTNRFYFTQEQCERLNSAFDRIEHRGKIHSGVQIETSKFYPDPEMNEDFYLTE